MKSDDRRQGRSAPLGPRAPAGPIFAGNLMALIAAAMLFDEDDDRPPPVDPQP